MLVHDKNLWLSLSIELVPSIQGPVIKTSWLSNVDHHVQTVSGCKPCKMHFWKADGGGGTTSSQLSEQASCSNSPKQLISKTWWLKLIEFAILSNNDEILHNLVVPFGCMCSTCLFVTIRCVARGVGLPLHWFVFSSMSVIDSLLFFNRSHCVVQHSFLFLLLFLQSKHESCTATCHNRSWGKNNTNKLGCGSCKMEQAWWLVGALKIHHLFSDHVKITILSMWRDDLQQLHDSVNRCWRFLPIGKTETIEKSSLSLLQRPARRRSNHHRTLPRPN